MKRVLFVDDEPRILDGLRRLLYPQRSQWHMSFASGGRAALAELQAQPYDIVVTDMRMPEMDGATLLTKVKESYPHIVRLVLSGHAELAAMMRVVPVCHQFLTKPCDPTILKDTIERACRLQAILQDEGLRRLVGGLGSLPSCPRTYDLLVRLLDEPTSSIRDVAKVIERDIGMSAKCLQLVNSAFFGLNQRVTSIERAVGFLGLATIKSLALSVEMFRVFEVDPRLTSYCHDSLQKHSLKTGSIAARLPEDKPTCEDAFTAGLLHDVGKLVFATKLSDEYVKIVHAATEQHRRIADVERERLGYTHAEIGAYLLGVWGLPYGIVEAVAFHCAPPIRDRTLGVPASVYIADRLSHEVDDLNEPNRPGAYPLDLAYIREIGMIDRLPAWRELAVSLAAIAEG